MEETNDEKREALRAADDFLATLSYEAAHANAPSPLALPVRAKTEHAPKRQKTHSRQEQTPVLGAAAEPAVKLGALAKPLTMDPPLSTETKAQVASGGGGVRARKMLRKTALEMWDEMDAKKAAEEEATEAKGRLAGAEDKAANKAGE